jgi:hypothetical protein
VKTGAVVLGLAALGGLIVLAVAGVTGATAILGTGVAIVVMIALGNIIGGRTTPNRASPDAGEGRQDGRTDAAENPEAEQRRGTMGP